MAKAHSLEDILQRQAVFWEVRRRLGEEGGPAARRLLAHLGEGPWITISKETGSSGVELARSIADRLGWQVYDREILGLIARETSMREAILSRLDERALGAFDDYLSQVFVGGPGQAAFQQDAARVVWGIARQGNAVILGRGANWLLRPEFGLRLRTVSPLAQRVETFARHEGIAKAEARARVESLDAQQRTFVHKAFGRAIDDPLGYDLVLNTDALGVETAAGIAIAALEAKLGAAR